MNLGTRMNLIKFSIFQQNLQHSHSHFDKYVNVFIILEAGSALNHSVIAF